MYLCISIGHIYIYYILRKSVSLHLTMIGCFVRYATLNARFTLSPLEPAFHECFPTKSAFCFVCFVCFCLFFANLLCVLILFENAGSRFCFSFVVIVVVVVSHEYCMKYQVID